MSLKASDAIAKSYKAFQDAYHRADADTISRMYTEDAELLIPERPVIRGREAIAQAWRHILVYPGNTVRVDTAELQEAGGWAYEVGRFTVSAPDGSVLNAGKYIVIWKRHAAGEWKMHRDIFNSDGPPADLSRGV